jgi:predicted phosphoribosyltransferase
MTDEELLEKISDGIGRAQRLPIASEWCRDAARAALSIAKPILRNEALEEAARVAGGFVGEWHSDLADGCAREIASAIRSLKTGDA